MTTSDKNPPVTPEPPLEKNRGTIKKSGLIRIINAAGYSLRGLKVALKGEAAFRQECLVALITLPVAVFLLPIEMMERTLIVSVTFLVLIVELLNSAIEAVVDRVGFEVHPLSGQAKDIGSAAVMMAIILWSYVWLEVIISVL